MSAIVQPTPDSDISDDGAAQSGLRLNVFTAHDTCVVDVAGELDVATRDHLVSASTAGTHAKVVIDLRGVTFMDCSGYGSLIDSRLRIEGDGGSLTVTGQSGQPARLCKQISELESI